MFQDEARFGRISDPRHCWAPKGIRPNVCAQMVREYTYAYAAVSPLDGIMDSLILPEVNAQMMSFFLAEVASRHPEEFILMFLDNAGWHITKNLNVPDNMGLVWLPPYSPECNPAEHIWEEVREKYFPNLVFQNLDAVEDTLVYALASLENNPKLVASLTGFSWIVCNYMNAT